MEDNFEGVTGQGWHKEDFKALTSQIKEHEALLRLKRRWLMDLSLSKREQERVKELLPPTDKILPESLIRADDVNYDDIRSCVARGCSAYNCNTQHHGVLGDLQCFKSRDDLKDVFFLLDDMTNKGLYSLVEILTGGLVKYEKTSWCMKRIINERLPKVLKDENEISRTKLEHIFQLLKDVTIFREYRAVCATPSEVSCAVGIFREHQSVCETPSEVYCAEGIKILDELENFPFVALRAMHRKVRGVWGYVPSIQSSKSGWTRGGLIDAIRKKCKKMLMELGSGDEPAKPLARALGVAGLTLKLILNQTASVRFRKFSPEIEALQNDLEKAIFCLNDSKRVSVTQLKRVLELLSPDAELSARSLRNAIRNLLIEYLFECSDMKEIPICLLETLDIINKKSELPRHKSSSSSEVHSSNQELMIEEIQKEVEYLLIVSAQAKQVVLDVLPEYAFDQDFAHAYMEDLEKYDSISDGDEQVSEKHQSCDYSLVPYGGSESICENSPVSTAKTNGFSPLSSPSSKLDVPLLSVYSTEIDSHLSHFSNTSHNEIRSGKPTRYSFATPKLEYSDEPVEQKLIVKEKSGNVNKYLEVQEACDAVGMIAYQFVGHMLHELAQMEGIELCQGARLYLRSRASVLEECKEHPQISLADKFSIMWKEVLEHGDFPSSSL